MVVKPRTNLEMKQGSDARGVHCLSSLVGKLYRVNLMGSLSEARPSGEDRGERTENMGEIKVLPFFQNFPSLSKKCTSLDGANAILFHSNCALSRA